MQRSKLIEPFSKDDEHFFGSYEAERVNVEGSLTFEFDTVEARAPSAQQVAHFTRFRRPVAWVMAAMGSLSLVALAAHAFRLDPRGADIAHIDSTTAIGTSAKSRDLASACALPGSPVLASAVEPTSEAPWSWTEFAESAIALVLEPTQSGTGRELPSLADSAMQASLVNDFTSELLSMCRDARS